ncbi:peptidase inhibitor family I36 protein [Streptomyces tauricus]|uniref:Peptidase inhibitor family I36 protein n=1 Tax=Streptomyces tauricus TaxID=68274 RepID=A0ABZ1JW29_9ACTN|nr:peptidase inhibitor family I36 protein [Streptomyces tauricus]
MVKKMALVAACAGLLATGVAVSPAAAAPAAWNDCPPGHFCLFEHGNGGALMYAYDECSPLIKNIGSVGEGDKISSYWNRSRFRGELYDWQGSLGFVRHHIAPANGSQYNLPAPNNDITDGLKVVC